MTAARLARQAADAAGRRVAVAGCIGPTGELLAPLPYRWKNALMFSTNKWQDCRRAALICFGLKPLPPLRNCRRPDGLRPLICPRDLKF